MAKHESDTHTVKGAGLARGPALLVGTILAAFGLILFLHAGDTPTSGFPDGEATGSRFLGFEANGWTAFFTTTAGVVLLFAAAQHLLAKALGLVVGLALAACVVLDLVDGPGVLGLAAANWATDLGWAIAAVILLLNVLAPRRKHTVADAGHGRGSAVGAGRTDGGDRALAPHRGAGQDDRTDTDRTVSDRTHDAATDHAREAGASRTPAVGTDRGPGGGTDRTPGVGTDRTPGTGTDRTPGTGDGRGEGSSRI